MGEGTEGYCTDLKILAATCNFRDVKDSLINWIARPCLAAGERLGTGVMLYALLPHF